MIPDHLPKEEEDWGETQESIAPHVDHAMQATCPAEKLGIEKFQGMLKRGSPEVAWRVTFKTARKCTSGDGRVPLGFPTMWDFYHSAKDKKTFDWGWTKYQELYPDGPWTEDDGTSGHPVQELRENLVQHHRVAEAHESKTLEELAPKKRVRVTKTQNEIISWLAINQFFDGIATSDQLGRKIQTAKSRISDKKRAREETDGADGRVSPSLRLSS